MFDTGFSRSTEERLRIVHCVRAPIGGIFRHVLDLAAEQTARGHLVGIVLDSTSGGAFEAEKIGRAAVWGERGRRRRPPFFRGPPPPCRCRGQSNPPTSCLPGASSTSSSGLV